MNKFIKNPIYPFSLIVSLGESDVDFLNLIESYEDLDLDNEELSLEQNGWDCGITVLQPRDNKIVLRTNFIPKTPEQIGDLSHEIFHAAQFIFESLRILITEETQEPFAYLIGFYTKEIFKLIEEENKTCEEIGN